MPTLEWIGKDKVINHHQDVPFRVLEKKYTYNAESSENMIIHGDNLLALKSLLPQYEGRVDCIYIDPPYNTGNEKWVYNDNVNDPRIKKWLGEVVGQEGEDLSRHDKWLCMMYPRLKLLYELLSLKGAIFISIDDNELSNLRMICDEIFGSINFVACVIWERKRGRDNSAKWFSKSHEYLLVYCRDKNFFNTNYLELDDDTKKAYKNPDNDPRGDYRMLGTWARGTQGGVKYDFTTKEGQYFSERLWLFSKENLQKLDEENKLIIRGDNIYRKMFLFENKGKIPETIWDDTSNCANASDEIKKIFGKIIFDTPKPTPYIKRIIQIATSADSIVLDSFSGSGITGQAVLEANKDGGNRKFILVEMMDYADTITAERVKRVIDGYGEGNKAVEGLGGNFSYYELGEPLFKEDKNLNEEVGEDEIRKYVYYMETKLPLEIGADDNRYYMGKVNDMAYYFYYNKGNSTTLNREFLATIKTKAAGYLIYADACALSKDTLDRNGIVFKKIPRDIKKL